MAKSGCCAVTTNPISGAVPPFNEYYAPVENASPAVKAFFDWFVSEVEDGRAPDVEGNLSYLFAYLYGVVDRFTEDGDYPTLAARFNFLREHYGDTKVTSYLSAWQSDAALVAGEWEEVWERSDELDPNVIRTVGQEIGSRRVRPADVLRLATPAPFTSWGRRHKAKVLVSMVGLLETLHDFAGKNFIDAFCDEYELRFAEMSDVEIDSLADDLDYGLNSESMRKALHRAKANPGAGSLYLQKAERKVFNGVPSNLSMTFEIDLDALFAGEPQKYEEQPVAKNTVELAGISGFAQVALEARARWIVRESENIARTEAGMPRVGDGWIAETELFKLVFDAFPGVRVLRHSRPSWLAPQHLDVYLPEFNIAIEFQGEQHYRPVDFFGGEANFAEQVRRDERKRKLCKKNGCLLIEVASGYDEQELLTRLRFEIAARTAMTDG